MRLPEFEFIQPHSLQEACSILEKHGRKAVVLAGGSALLVGLRYGLSKPGVVVDLKGLTGLHDLGRDGNGGLTIGSMVTLETIEKSSIILNECVPLAQTARLVAVPSVRYRATLGGNLCLDTRCIYYNQSQLWRSGLKACFKLGGEVCNAVEKGRHCQAVYQGDLGPVLMALGAEVKIVSAKGEKIIPLTQFFTGKGENPNVLKPGEILTEVRIPASNRGAIGAYEKLRVRDGMDFPMAGVAVRVKRSRDGAIEQAKIVLGAVGSSPIEAPKAAVILEGHEPTDDLLRSAAQEVMERAQPVRNLAMNAGYRRKMVGALVNRALGRALAMAPEVKAR